MLKQGILEPSQSPMASPLVCILKEKDGRDGVRLAGDYRHVNKYTYAPDSEMTYSVSSGALNSTPTPTQIHTR